MISHRSRSALSPSPLLCRAAALSLVSACVLAGACEPQQRIVRYHPFLADVAGAKTGTPTVGPRYDRFQDPTAVPDGKIVIDNPNGSKTLVSKTIRHLMTHIETQLDEAIAEGDWGPAHERLLNQVISEETNRHFRDEGRQPKEAIEFLIDHRRDIALMFSRMPFGEQSPTIIMQPDGPRRYIVRLTGAATKGLAYTELWVVQEKGNWRLLWIS